jgi:hypothetical protein
MGATPARASLHDSATTRTSSARSRSTSGRRTRRPSTRFNLFNHTRLGLLDNTVPQSTAPPNPGYVGACEFGLGGAI